MGKALIIKGADFSAHSIGPIQRIIQMEFEQSNIMYRQSDCGVYPKPSAQDQVVLPKRCRTTNGTLIEVAPNQTITISGLKDLFYRIFEYQAYTNGAGDYKTNYAFTGINYGSWSDNVSNCLTPYVSSSTDSNIASGSSVNTITYTNTHEMTVYIGMRVGWNVDSGKNDTNILPEEISVFVEYD